MVNNGMTAPRILAMSLRGPCSGRELLTRDQDIVEVRKYRKRYQKRQVNIEVFLLPDMDRGVHGRWRGSPGSLSSADRNVGAESNCSPKCWVGIFLTARGDWPALSFPRLEPLVRNKAAEILEFC